MCTDQVPQSKVTAIRLKTSRSNNSTKGHWGVEFLLSSLNAFLSFLSLNACRSTPGFRCDLFLELQWTALSSCIILGGLILGEVSETYSTRRLSWSYCYCSSSFIDFGKMDKHSNCFIIWSVLPYMGMARSTLSRPFPPRWLVATSSEM